MNAHTKHRRLGTWLLVAALGLMAILSARAQVPQMINYQGRVVVGTTNFNGSGQFKFALVDSAGATTYWSNDGTSTAGSAPAAAVTLPVSQGLYSVMLGSSDLSNMTAIPPAVFNHSDVRLRVWFNDGSHGFQLLSPDQRIASVGYAVMAGTVPDGSITSDKIANGAVGTAQFAPNAYLNGTAANVPLSGVTGMNDTVKQAAANQTNAAGGLAGLDSSGLLSQNQMLQSILQVPDAGSRNVVAMGDSITVGACSSTPVASVPAVPLGSTTIVPTYATDWVSSVMQMGFFKNGATMWNLGQGSQKVGEGLAQFYHSPGVPVTASMTNGSNAATITSVGLPGFVQSGEEVTSIEAGIPDNTTASLAAINATCKFTTDAGGFTSTMTVVGPIGAITNGSFILSSCSGIYNGNINIPANTTVTISGSTITTSAPIYIWQTFSKPVVCKLYFVNPSVTLSHSFTGETGTHPLTLGGTLITSTATFTAGSTSVTVTGTTTGLISNMGIGSTKTAPGSTFTLAGTSMTLSAPATGSGSVTFVASTPTYNAETPSNTYTRGINTTPYLLSPNVTGIPGIFLNFYGVNDAGTGANFAMYQTAYLALNAAARSAGYTVVDMTQFPLAGGAFYGYGDNLGLQDSMTEWTRSIAYPDNTSGWDYLFDVSAQFSSGHPPADLYHYTDGIHPNDLGYQRIAGFVNDQLFKKIAPNSTLFYNPFTNGGINENWLPPTATLTDQTNIFTSSQTITTQGANPTTTTLSGSGITIAATGTDPATLTLSSGNSNNAKISLQAEGVDKGLLLYDNLGTRVRLSNATGGNSLDLNDDGTNTLTGDLILASGNAVISTEGKTLTLKGGSNAAGGSVKMLAGSATITSTAIAANSVIILSIKAPLGTIGTSMPQVIVTDGSATIKGLATDNSIYNWAMLLVNQ